MLVDFIKANLSALDGIAKLFVITSSLIGVITVLVRQVRGFLERRHQARMVEVLGRQSITVENFQNALPFFIAPHCQPKDPSDQPEPVATSKGREALFKTLDHIIQSNSEERFILVLADSGMGKTTALLNYFDRFSRKPILGLSIHFASLAVPESLARLGDPLTQSRTVLLLDALDEDQEAILNLQPRLLEVLQFTANFYKVIITCRTQFFPAGSQIPRETGLRKVGPRKAGESRQHLFHHVFLSPFNSDEADRYIKLRYDFWDRDRRSKGRLQLA